MIDPLPATREPWLAALTNCVGCSRGTSCGNPFCTNSKRRRTALAAEWHRPTAAAGLTPVPSLLDRTSATLHHVEDSRKFDGYLARRRQDCRPNPWGITSQADHAAPSPGSATALGLRIWRGCPLALTWRNRAPTHMCEHRFFNWGSSGSQVQILSARPEISRSRHSRLVIHLENPIPTGVSSTTSSATQAPHAVSVIRSGVCARDYSMPHSS